MNDREQRITDALRKGSRPRPPAGLNQMIKDEIPDPIVPARARSASHQIWLVAAALVMMIGAGWLALELVAPERKTSPVELADATRETAPQEQSRSDTRALEPPAPAPTEFSEEPEAQSVEGTASDDEIGRLASASPPPASASDDRGKREAFEELYGQREESVANATRQRRSDAAEPRRPAEPPPTEVVTTGEFAPVPAQRDRDVTVAADSAYPVEGKVAEKAAPASELAPMSAPSVRIEASGAEQRDAPTLEFEEIRRMVLGGTLPPADSVDVAAIINHFDYGDRPPWRRGNVSLYVEGGVAPFRPGRWYTIRVGLRSAPAAILSSDARLEIRFDPATAILYRVAGAPEAHRTVDSPRATIEIGEIPPDGSRSWVFEVKLPPEPEIEDTVVVAELYLDTEAPAVVRTLGVGHLAHTWRTSSSSLQLATLAAVWGELLSGHPAHFNTIELTQRAAELDALRNEDPDALELKRLIDATVRIGRRN